MNITIRPFRSSDLPTLKKLTVECFDGVSLDQDIERCFGLLKGHDWRWRKARHIDDDVAANAAGIFVAESDVTLVGYVTTRVDHKAGKGWIPNLAVAAEARGQGIGRQLIEHALAYFRAEGMECVMIETMAQNAIGQHLYPACGFVEISRQAHYARKL